MIVAFEALQNWLDGHLLAHGGEAFGRAQCLVKFGKPEQGIPEAANELHSDVVVMGARGLSALSAGRNNFIGSIAYEVACSSERPVLIVPQTATRLVFGLLMGGSGEATARGLRIEARPSVAADAPLVPAAGGRCCRGGSD